MIKYRFNLEKYILLFFCLLVNKQKNHSNYITNYELDLKS